VAMTDAVPHLDPRHAQNLVFRYILERRARQTPDQRYVTFVEEATTWTWSETDAHANRAANLFASLGVAKGGVVSVLCDNTRALVQSIFGATKLGAIVSPLNTALRAGLLRHVLGVAQPRVLVCQGQYAARLLHDDVGPLPSVVLVAGDCDAPAWASLATRTDVRSFDDAAASAGDAAPPDPGIEYWDPYAIIFTSGTTGPSKGVLCPYAQLYAQVQHTTLPVTSADDVFLGDLPLFHVGALLAFMATLQHGARWVVVSRVRIERYLDIVRTHGVTHITVLPAIVNFLEKQPRRLDDADNPLRIVLTGSFFDSYDEWCARFGIAHGYGYFNMTEICSPLMTGLDPARRDGTGRVRPGVTVRLVDEHDRPVPAGQPGELVIRPDLPWEINLGYVGNPDATQKAWRNGWFHTGDLFVADDTGHYSYLDRTKDSIRRRGENISSFEVEHVMARHPAVLRCAAIGVPSDQIRGEDEVMVCLQLVPGTTIDEVEFIAYLAERLPRFAVPRFVEVFDELPTTASEKVRKVELRQRGVTPCTWDRETAGIGMARSHQTS
jgi:crotonobetaine/carnitine-CoA ligase